MTPPPLVCLCHLRWAFTFQRPNHLMVRFARERPVYYVEEPVFETHDGFESGPHLRTREVMPNLWVCTPHLPAPPEAQARVNPEETVADLLERFAADRGIEQPALWYYTPMALPLGERLNPSVVVYDCMDELTLFLGAPKELVERERALLSRADLVFTGGHSLYRAKRAHHRSVHAFPSSVDVEHFRAPAGGTASEPADQQGIPHPRIGFFGVIDERMDLELLRDAAVARPNYQFVLIGPVVKISDSALPRLPNIHYLGSKQYAELPAYLHGWDVAIMPFALNDATRFISPTKTLEYLAAEKPVVSTAIADVVVPYGERGQVTIADRDSFPAALDAALAQTPEDTRARATQALEGTSWDGTWAKMAQLIREVEQRQQRPLDATRDETFAHQTTTETTGAATCTTT
ncbi:MAG TPA: glycosyltransferase [Polyangiaceae bacterium]|nr:glycosyltransferase [Polyangiaceae bacterium]